MYQVDPVNLTYYVLHMEERALSKSPLRCPLSLREFMCNLGTSNTDLTLGRVEDVLQEVQYLERQSHTRSRFRRLAHRLEPVIDFLIMYSPAVDMFVQFDVAPSAIVWGSLKSLIKASCMRTAF